MKSNHTRRQFLKNSALATLVTATLPSFASVKRNSETAKCLPTTLDLYGQGPFYKTNPPLIVNNMLADVNEPGTRLVLSGNVRTLDCSAVIPDTEIDVWHANDSGAYDNTGYKFRGITHSNAQGFYIFETILPGKYLNGSTFRPRHIHFKITAPGATPLITQLYFSGDTEIPNDAAASVTSGTYDATSRIISLANVNGKMEGTWDIALDAAGTTGAANIHLEKGMIYSASPNPFADSIDIFYGIFKPAKVSLRVYDINGKQVAHLEEQHLTPQKYHARWKCDSSIGKGIYFIALHINEMQVHYQKVVKL